MRSIATALETYFIDHRTYPAMRPFRMFEHKEKKLKKSGAWGLCYIEHGGIGVTGLTTPISYLTSLFVDPFNEVKGLPFAYYTAGDNWIVFSPGPDRDFDIIPHIDFDPTIPQPSLHLMTLTYDGTNGTTSDGDVWRVKQ